MTQPTDVIFQMSNFNTLTGKYFLLFNNFMLQEEASHHMVKQAQMQGSSMLNKKNKKAEAALSQAQDS